MHKRLVSLLVALLLVLAACSSSGSEDTTTTTAAAGGEDTTTTTAAAGGEDTTTTTATTTTAEAAAISGKITVLTNRTDIVDTVFQDYKATFNETYPDIEVEFEAITDYEGEVKIRMNTEDYGDVLLIPAALTPDQLSDFFVPLGTVDDLGQTYRYINEQAFEGQVYGLATFGTATGLVYNKAVWKAAGITDLPTTTDGFLAALQAIKDTTDSTPFYTNYAAGWPMSQWEANRGSISGNPDYVNEMAGIDAPWSEPYDHYTIDSLLFDIVAAGLAEEDPTTTDWELSKELLGSGEIATMMLGSWSIVQMQEAAADAADIGYMPFPNNVDGITYSVSGGDWKIAVNKYSENQEAALAWINFFLNDAGFPAINGAIPPNLDAEFPATLSAFVDLGVEFMTTNPAPEGEEGVVDNIAAEAEIDLWGNIYRQNIIDAARGASGQTMDEVFADLNARWAAARAEVENG